MAEEPKARVVHLTSVHGDRDVRIFHKECRTLAAAGYDVTLVAPSARPGEVTVDGVRILTVPQPRDRRERFLRTVPAVWRTARRLGADLYHLHDPELIPVGFLLKATGARVVLDVHEDLPRQILDKPWIPGRLRRPVALGARLAEWTAARGFAAIVAATPAIAEHFPAERTIVVQNFPLLGELWAADGPPYAERPAEVVFVGGITEIRGALEMVAAMAALPAGGEVRLVLAGSISPPELEARMQRTPGWERVTYLGWQERDAVRDLLARARAGLVLYLPAANHLRAQPNKLFEYMSAGIPVIASDFPLWRRIVEEVGCGLLADPTDPRAIAEAIAWVLAHPREAEAMGRAGRQAVEERFNWEVEARELLALYADLLTPNETEGLKRCDSSS